MVVFQTRTQDTISGILHVVGLGLAIAGLVYLVKLSVQEGSTWHVVSFSIFGASMIALYLSSSVYHLCRAMFSWETVARKVDHAMIFILIAGTYTPFCLATVRGPWGWSVFAVILAMAFFGVFQSIFWINAPRWGVLSVYLGMGWIGLVIAVPLYQQLSFASLGWLLAGGISYSVGAVIYGLKKPNPVVGVIGFHEIWHVFVLAGTSSHYVSVLFLL